MLTTKTLLNLFYKVLCFVTQSLAKTRLFKTIMIKVGFNFVNANKIHGHGTCYIKTLIMTSYRNQLTSTTVRDFEATMNRCSYRQAATPSLILICTDPMDTTTSLKCSSKCTE